MKFLDEYRDPAEAKKWAHAIHTITTREWTVMEVCGGQTHAIVKFGIDEMLPDKINIVHGPGCPVCVTPIEIIDQAVEIAGKRGVIFCSFGDMLRVPGSKKDLLSVKAEGGDVRVVYSPLDSVKIAQENPSRQVVFFAVGFETTAPPNAMAVVQASRLGLGNYSVLVSHARVPPAMKAILGSPHNRVQGFLAAGHVCTVMGYSEYPPIANEFKVPIVVTGFEPLDILQGLFLLVQQLEEGRHEVENQYVRSVTPRGNERAQHVMNEVFGVTRRTWRGVGEIPDSGLGLTEKYASFDAEKRFGVGGVKAEESGDCISGEIMRGFKKPRECPAFATRCTPEKPLGAPMVSSEGACAAYYRYRKFSMPARVKTD